MPDLLIEIGTEEIPAGYIEPALADMGQKLADFFEKGRVSAGTPEVMGTPRRLVVHGDVAGRARLILRDNGIEPYEGGTEF